MKKDLWSKQTEEYSTNDLGEIITSKKLEEFTYLLFYNSVGSPEGKGIRDFISEFCKNECNHYESIGIGGGGGIIFTTNHDFTTIHDLLANDYEFEYFLYDKMTESTSGKTNTEKFKMFNKMLKG